MTHTLKTLLALPADELRVMVAECAPCELWMIKKNGYYYREGACGYTDRTSEAWKLPLEEAKKYEMYADNPKVAFCEKVILHKALSPDYPNSLDAMKPLEDGLTDEEYEDFKYTLHRVVAYHLNITDSDQINRAVISATAHHRAVSYVATKLKL